MQTIRRQMSMLLKEMELSAKDLSQRLKIREKEVFEHLVHLKRSMAAQKKELIVIPARCMECGYLFQGRSRFTSPGRCPRCKGEHIEDPRYRIDEES